MSTRFQRITPFLWFASEAEEAARFYTGIFPNSRIGTVTRYTAEAAKACGQKEGSAMTVAFELDGQSFVALNGGPAFKFTEAVSLVVNCETQAEVDRYWTLLSGGGEEQQCGWLKDKYGLSWQVVPTELPQLMAYPKAVAALMQMRKIDLDALREAAGKAA